MLRRSPPNPQTKVWPKVRSQHLWRLLLLLDIVETGPVLLQSHKSMIIIVIVRMEVMNLEPRRAVGVMWGVGEVGPSGARGAPRCLAPKQAPPENVGDRSNPRTGGADTDHAVEGPTGFYCLNKGARGRYVYRSRVNDGICDCCDGSDEYDFATFGREPCPNICAEENRAQLAAERERIQRLEEGAREKLKYLSIAEVELGKINASYKEALLEVEMAEVAVSASKQQVRKAQEEEQRRVAQEAREMEREVSSRLGLEHLEAPTLRRMVARMLAAVVSLEKGRVEGLRDYGVAAVERRAKEKRERKERKKKARQEQKEKERKEREERERKEKEQQEAMSGFVAEEEKEGSAESSESQVEEMMEEDEEDEEEDEMNEEEGSRVWPFGAVDHEEVEKHFSAALAMTEALDTIMMERNDEDNSEPDDAEKGEGKGYLYDQALRQLNGSLGIGKEGGGGISAWFGLFGGSREQKRTGKENANGDGETNPDDEELEERVFRRASIAALSCNKNTEKGAEVQDGVREAEEKQRIAEQQLQEAGDKVERLEKERIPGTFGMNGEFYPLKDECFSAELNKFEWKLCPFKDASQKDINQGSPVKLGFWDRSDGGFVSREDGGGTDYTKVRKWYCR